MGKLGWTVAGMAFALFFIAINLVHFAIAIGIGIFLLWFLNEEDWKQIEAAKGTTPDAGELAGMARAAGKRTAEFWLSHPAEKYTTKELGLRVAKGSKHLIDSSKKVFKSK